MKQLLVDYLPFDITANAVNESIAKNSGKLIVTGILQRAEAKNQNGRIYPKDTLVREAKKYSETFIKQRRALGELDHPESSVVNLQNASHNICLFIMVSITTLYRLSKKFFSRLCQLMSIFLKYFMKS